MDTLYAMRLFVKTVDLGSLSAAARELGTTQPTVGKILAQLEKHVSTRLFERSTRGLSPTAQGRKFYRDAKSILEQFDTSVSEIQGQTGHAAGLLRINAPVALGQHCINLLVGQFLEAHPSIEIELTLNDRYIDLVDEGVDIVFRLGGALPQNAIGRHLSVTPRYLVASPHYLDRHGTPTHPGELATHEFVRFAWTPGDFIELHGENIEVRVQTTSRYRVNNAMAIRQAVAIGSGIAICPEWLVRDLLDCGTLVRVLPAWSARDHDLYLLYPSRLYQPLRTTLFIDFVVERFKSTPGFKPPDYRHQAGA